MRCQSIFIIMLSWKMIYFWDTSTKLRVLKSLVQYVYLYKSVAIYTFVTKIYATYYYISRHMMTTYKWIIFWLIPKVALLYRHHFMLTTLDRNLNHLCGRNYFLQNFSLCRFSGLIDFQRVHGPIWLPKSLQNCPL